MVPVLAKETDMDKMLDEILNGEDPGNVKCDNEVKELPGEFKTWMSDNQDRIQDAKERGTLPYFLMDNKRLVGLEKPTAQDIAKERHAARTEQEVEAIKKHGGKERLYIIMGKTLSMLWVVFLMLIRLPWLMFLSVQTWMI